MNNVLSVKWLPLANCIGADLDPASKVHKVFYARLRKQKFNHVHPKPSLFSVHMLWIFTPLGFIKIPAVSAKTTTARKSGISPLSQSFLSLCKEGKTISIWGSLEQIRIVSTVGFYLFKQGRWIDNHHMPFWGPITQLCVKLENLFSQSSNGCSGH